MLWYLLALWLAEWFLVNESPLWLAWLARIPLPEVRRFSLPPPRPERVQRPGYREPAFRITEAQIPTIEAMRVRRLRIVPSRDGRTYALTRPLRKRSFLGRITVHRDGDDVILRSAFVPLPLVFVPALAFGAWTAFAAGIEGTAAGFLIGVSVGLVVRLSSAYAAAIEAMRDGGEAIEAAIRAAVEAEADEG